MSAGPRYASASGSRIRRCADFLLLATAPAEIHQLVRSETISSTLAIEEIRRHGTDKALARLTTAASRAKATGNAKVTKKALDKPATDKISAAQAKQLLQALQAVRADAAFAQLGHDTTALVLDLLVDFPDVTAQSAQPTSAVVMKKEYPQANADGVYLASDCQKSSARIRERDGRNHRSPPFTPSNSTKVSGSCHVRSVPRKATTVGCQVAKASKNSIVCPLRSSTRTCAIPEQKRWQAGAAEIECYVIANLQQSEEAQQIAAWARTTGSQSLGGKIVIHSASTPAPLSRKREREIHRPAPRPTSTTSAQPAADHSPSASELRIENDEVSPLARPDTVQTHERLSARGIPYRVRINSLRALCGQLVDELARESELDVLDLIRDDQARHSQYRRAEAARSWITDAGRQLQLGFMMLDRAIERPDEF